MPYFPKESEMPIYQCGGCGGWFRPWSQSCLVAHAPGTELIQRLRDVKTCEDAGEAEKCYADSGPMCGRHDYADMYAPLLREAADALETSHQAGYAAGRAEVLAQIAKIERERPDSLVMWDEDLERPDGACQDGHFCVMCGATWFTGNRADHPLTDCLWLLAQSATGETK